MAFVTKESVWGSAFMPCSDLLSVNTTTVIRVMINMSTVMFVVMQWIDFGSSFLEVLISWQTEEQRRKKSSL